MTVLHRSRYNQDIMRGLTRVVERKAAFTLLELLVVISILSLLISVLLPSLKAARDQAKRVVCQSNMKNINMGLLTYVNEFDSYPLHLRVDPHRCNRVSWATWSFGGWTGQDFETYCNAEGTGRHCYQTHERPLSVYLTEPQQIPPDGRGADAVFGTADDQVVEMPVFRCPSDTASTQWRWRTRGPSQTVREMSAYEQVGTSYQMNYYWFYQALARSDVRTGPCRRLRQWRKAFEIGRWLWRQADEHGGASRFVTLVEDPFDWGIAQGLRASADAMADETYRHSMCGEQTMGFHGQWSRHMIAFLDGHVDYTFADTRYQRDAHWTVTNERWYDTRRAENCVQLPDPDLAPRELRSSSVMRTPGS